MNKYKICPMCKAKNASNVLECSECGTDLMSIRVVDDSYSESEANQDDRESSSNTVRMVRICECGFANEPAARKCSSCGEDISDIIPSAQENDREPERFCLSSLDGDKILSLICPSEIIIGREHVLAVQLKSKSFVSRKHARITVTEEGVFIENLSKANGTYLNNEKLDDDKAYKLCLGDEIGLGGLENQYGRQESAAYFIFGVE